MKIMFIITYTAVLCTFAILLFLKNEGTLAMGGRDILLDETTYAQQRKRMVKDQLVSRGIKDEKVLEVMSEVPRHLFIPEDKRAYSYYDQPIPIGFGQTISQPYIVALMTELLQLKGDEIVLEIGTGSGYQSAVLARLAKQVYTIEIIEQLGKDSRERLQTLGYTNVEVRIGDGYKGWPEHAPFDAIIVTAAADHIPQPLIDQLKPGGRMVIPVGGVYSIQDLVLITKDPASKVKKESIIPVRFVPLIHKKER